MPYVMPTLTLPTLVDPPLPRRSTHSLPIPASSESTSLLGHNRLPQRSPPVSTRSVTTTVTDPVVTVAFSTHQKRKESLTPPRKQPESPRSPLLRHVTTRSYMNNVTDAELACYANLESEVSKFWSMIEADLNRVEAFYEGKLAEYTLKLDLWSRQRSSYSDISAAVMGPAPDLHSLKDLYIGIVQLQNFVRLNGTGFRKIVKKFDKSMHRNSLPTFMENLKSRSFMESAPLVILVERTTDYVSRDKLIEFRSDAQKAVSNPSKAVKSTNPYLTWFLSMNSATRPWAMALSFLLSAIIYAVNVIPDDPVATRAASFLTLVVSLWLFKAMPFHATSMFIPALAVFFDVLRDEADTEGGGATLTSEKAGALVLSSFFNHNTFLILGGYSISAAFSRCSVEKRLAASFQQHFEHSPRLFLLAMMFLGLFLSMWISNHTAPVLCISLLMPIISDLPSNSSFVKSLLLGVAFACNIGGMMTPIASMQNIIAIQQIHNNGIALSFGAWVLNAAPLCIVSVVIVWLIILVVVNPDDVETIPQILAPPSTVPMSRTVLVSSLSLLTIVLWAFSSYTTAFFGDLGIISLCFMVVMFGSGILTEVDLNSFAWHTLFLLGGSNVLGKVIESSQLLEHMSGAIKHALPDSRVLAAAELFFFACLMATFVSHSVAAIVIVPIIAHIGKSYDAVQDFSFGAALAISAAMALPFSSFPNVYCLLVTDDFQKPFLSGRDFFNIGVPASLLTVVFITVYCGGLGVGISGY
jgi:phosphate transporter